MSESRQWRSEHRSRRQGSGRRSPGPARIQRGRQRRARRGRWRREGAGSRTRRGCGHTVRSALMAREAVAATAAGKVAATAAAARVVARVAVATAAVAMAAGETAAGGWVASSTWRDSRVRARSEQMCEGLVHGQWVRTRAHARPRGAPKHYLSSACGLSMRVEDANARAADNDKTRT